MNINALGASSVQALYLQTLLSSAGRSSDSDSTSSITDGSDVLSISSMGQWAARTQGTDPFRADFDKLGSLISSGDLAGAKEAYQTMADKLKANAGQGSDPFAEDFAAIGTALESGDASAAKNAWETMQTDLKPFAPERGGKDGRNPMKEDMDKLGALIGAGDLTGAQALFRTMQERMQNGAAARGDSQGRDLKSEFAAVGSALESGDLASAKEAWTTLQQDLEAMAARHKKSDQASTRITELDAMLLSATWTTSLGSTTLGNQAIS